MYRGYTANLARNSTVAGVEIATYDTVKTSLQARFGFADSMPLHLTSAAACGAVATIVASPLDTIKSRMMAGSYTGLLQCAADAVRTDGALSLYRGVVPMFVRLVGWNAVCFVTYEQLKAAVIQFTDDLDAARD